jgi:hypothetical protein
MIAVRRVIMGMTERQKAFLEQFWELYREAKAPIHYSVVAEKLRISNISAYDMLRLLKQKGMVASQYLLPKKRRAPGLSSAVLPLTRASAGSGKISGRRSCTGCAEGRTATTRCWMSSSPGSPIASPLCCTAPRS